MDCNTGMGLAGWRFGCCFSGWSGQVPPVDPIRLELVGTWEEIMNAKSCAALTDPVAVAVHSLHTMVDEDRAEVDPAAARAPPPHDIRNAVADGSRRAVNSRGLGATQPVLSRTPTTARSTPFRRRTRPSRSPDGWVDAAW